MADTKTLVYIVDDEPVQAEILKDHLSTIADYEIKIFYTGEECLAALDNPRKPNIVFLDYNLDSRVRDAMNGIEVLKEVKKRSPKTECVMLSGQNKMEVAAEAIKHGAYEYITKGEGAMQKAEKTAFNINTLLNLAPGWDSVTSPERADIVFADRNKQFGAYVIRKGYQRTTATALLLAVSFFTLIVLLPVIVKLLSKSELSSNNKPVEVTVELKEPPPVDDKEPPPPPPPPPPPTIETVKFTPPVVVDKPVEDEQPPPQEKLSETTVGVVTQEGSKDAVELPPEPQAVADPEENKVFTFVEEMPTFPGGESALYEYISKNIKYPPLARENGITGKVFINFVVDKDGNIKDVKVLRGIGGGCDEEAKRVISNMPNWKPGKQNGRAVQVSYNMPVNFTLK